MGVTYIAFMVSCSVWLSFELWLNFHDRAKVDRSTNRNSTIYLFILTSAALGVCIVAQYTGILRIPVTQDSRLIAGTVIIITGSFIRWWAIWYLGKYFQIVVTVQDGQKILKRGPYRFVRHPAYSGAMLVFIGFGLGLGSWIGLAATIVFPLLGYLRRIKVEEELMITRFQNEYLSYIGETKKLIPFIY